MFLAKSLLKFIDSLFFYEFHQPKKTEGGRQNVVAQPSEESLEVNDRNWIETLRVCATTTRREQGRLNWIHDRPPPWPLVHIFLVLPI